MAFVKLEKNRFRIDGEIAENHAILVDLTASIIIITSLTLTLTVSDSESDSVNVTVSVTLNSQDLSQEYAYHWTTRRGSRFSCGRKNSKPTS